MAKYNIRIRNRVFSIHLELECYLWQQLDEKPNNLWEAYITSDGETYITSEDKVFNVIKKI